MRRRVPPGAKVDAQLETRETKRTSGTGSVYDSNEVYITLIDYKPCVR
jgi:hypothetical protein